MPRDLAGVWRQSALNSANCRNQNGLGGVHAPPNGLGGVHAPRPDQIPVRGQAGAPTAPLARISASYRRHRG
jgi:hypothetical protein